jgi:hypothetical protein
MDWPRYWVVVFTTAFSVYFMLIAFGNAEPARTALQGKSVLLNWSETRTIVDDRGQERIRPFVANVTLYISTKGRIFSLFKRKGTADASNVSNGSEKDVPEEVLHWRFEGSTLAGYLTFVRGVRKISVTFDDEYKKCSMNTFYGKERGTTIIINPLTGGSNFELKAATIDSTDCQVLEGNIFDKPN